MARSRWPLFGLIAAGSLAVGSCSGALVGHYTVTGGLYPNAGWGVPSFGSEATNERLPAAVAAVRTVPAPQYAGYYPAYVPAASSPDTAASAARDYAALYDEPSFEPASFEPASFAPAVDEPDAWPTAPGPSADVAAYSDREAEPAEGAGD